MFSSTNTKKLFSKQFSSTLLICFSPSFYQFLPLNVAAMVNTDLIRTIVGIIGWYRKTFGPFYLFLPSFVFHVSIFSILYIFFAKKKTKQSNF